MSEAPAPAPEVENASAITTTAWERLQTNWHDGNLAIIPLLDFLHKAEQNKLPVEDKRRILEQAIFMFEKLYPHLPFKLKFFHFDADPVRHLKLKLPYLAEMREREFHSFVVTQFARVRDAHSLYGAPSPFRGAIAFLPFRIRYYTDSQGRHFVVTRLIPGFEHEHFQVGAEILTWTGNGLTDPGRSGPIERYIKGIASRLSGGNTAAEFARATNHATLRPLTFCQPPTEDVARLEYRVPGSDEIRAIRIPWGVASGVTDASAFAGSAFSLSAAQETAALWGQVLYPRSSAHHRVSLPDPSVDVFEVVFTGGTAEHSAINQSDLVIPNRPDAKLAYVRITSFRSTGTTDALVDEFRQVLSILDQQAPDGLILDIRSNPGGNIEAAERMLQMLTPRHIEPALFHLANTPTVVDILKRIDAQQQKGESADVPDLAAWVADARNPPMPDGEFLTTGQPLTDRVNEIGQIYQGPVVLLIDALTYSAAEIFAGGFQDHSIGPVVGMDGNTGGGGANVWTHAELLERLGSQPGVALAPLPADATMSLAVRRSSRVGSESGKPIEDIGVAAPDAFCFVPDSADDVISEFPGLIRFACQWIGDLRTSRLDVKKFETQPDGSVKLDLETRDIDSLNVLLDDQAVVSARPVTRDPPAFTLTAPAVPGNASPSRLRIEGFTLAPGDGTTQSSLAAARTVVLRAPAADQGVTDSTIDPTGSQ